MKYNTLYEFRIFFKTTTPAYVYTFNDYDVSYEFAKDILNKKLEYFGDRVLDWHLIQYELVPIMNEGFTSGVSSSPASDKIAEVVE